MSGGETLARGQNEGEIPPSRGVLGWGRFVPLPEDGGWFSWQNTLPPRSFLISFSQTVEAIHLPPAPDSDIFGGPLWAKKVNAWALELERERMEEQREKKAWVKKGSPYLLIKAAGIPRLPTCQVNSLIPQAPR